MSAGQYQVMWLHDSMQVICRSCPNETNLLSDPWSNAQTLAYDELQQMVAEHNYDYHDPRCIFRSHGMNCGYKRSEHPIAVGPEGKHEFEGRRPH